MKSLILVFSLFVLFLSVAQAKVNAPEGRFVFPLTKEYGPLRRVEITFHTEKRDSVDKLFALVTGSLDKSKTEAGKVACVTSDGGNEIKCERNDGGGDFTLLKTKTISGSSFKYTLKLIYFALGEEGEEDPVAIKSPNEDKAIEIPGTKESK